MRLVRSALLAAALSSAATAGAQPTRAAVERSTSGPIATQALAPGEILLEISGLGMGQARPDTAKLTVSVRVEADAEAAAQARHDAVVRRIREAARAAGVADADIDATSTGNLMVFDVEEPPPTTEEPAHQVVVPVATDNAATAPLVRVQIEPPRQRPFKFSTIQITVRQPDRVEALQTAIQRIEGATAGTPRYSVSDDRAARGAARADALAKARADAEAYATALNMRVVRIVRISERTGFDFMSTMFGAMVGGGPDTMRERFEPSEGRVPVPVFVGVDFILAPR